MSKKRDIPGLTPIEKKPESSDERLIETLNQLVKAIQSKDDQLSVKVLQEIQKMQSNPNVNEQAIELLTAALNEQTEVLKNKPTSFVFNVMKDENGNIDKVIVRPTK